MMFGRRRWDPFMTAVSALFALESAAAAAQISTDIVDRNRESFHRQATDPDMKREGGTQPRDWDYILPEGVTTRQVTFYVDGGFSFRSKIDMFSNFRNRDVRPGSTLDQIADTARILFLPAEKDELTGGPAGAQEAAQYLAARGVVAQAVVYPELTHFQAYSHTGFEVGSTLAADWFLKYLAPSAGSRPATDPQEMWR